MANESNGELSLLDSDFEYEPVDGSSSASDSEEEQLPTKRMRHSEKQQASKSSSIPPCDMASTSDAVHPPHRCQPPRIRAHTAVPEALLNPVWLPSD